MLFTWFLEGALQVLIVAQQLVKSVELDITSAQKESLKLSQPLSFWGTGSPLSSQWYLPLSPLKCKCM